MVKETTTYKDLTGQFPYQSSRGNNYVFVAYNYDGNAILIEPMPNREADTIILCWEKCYDRLINNGVVTTYYILDNECSTAFEHALKMNKSRLYLCLLINIAVTLWSKRSELSKIIYYQD